MVATEVKTQKAVELTDHVRMGVKSTIPALEEHGLEIVDKFYSILFERYPAVRAYFSDGAFKHEPGNPPIQVQRLGAAVIAYAKHIDQPTVLMDTIKKIGEVHVSRNVLPPHYPFVAECLLAALEQVLGYKGEEWKIALQWLANVFITVEDEIRERCKKTAGYVGFRQYSVDDVIVEDGGDFRSLHLKPGEGVQILDTRNAGGKFVCLRVATPGVKFQSKFTAYLSNVDTSDHIRVTVNSSAIEKFAPLKNVGVSPIFGLFDCERITGSSKVAMISTGIEVGRMFAVLRTLLDKKQEPRDSVEGQSMAFIGVQEFSANDQKLLLEKELASKEDETPYLAVRKVNKPPKAFSADDAKEIVDEALHLSAPKSNAIVLLSPEFKDLKPHLDERYTVEIVE